MGAALRRTVACILGSGLLVAGVLFLALGAGNWAVGRTKLTRYERLAAATRTGATDPVTVRSGFSFTSVNEEHERHNIAVAKVHYYSVVLAAGRLLVLTGLVLLLLGYARRDGRSGGQNKTLLDSA
jgi:hypothetical protein